MYRCVVSFALMSLIGFSCVTASLDNCHKVKEEFSKFSSEDFVPETPVGGK